MHGYYQVKYRSGGTWHALVDKHDLPILFGNPVAAWSEATDLLNQDRVVAVSVEKS